MNSVDWTSLAGPQAQTSQASSILILLAVPAWTQVSVATKGLPIKPNLQRLTSVATGSLASSRRHFLQIGDNLSYFCCLDCDTAVSFCFVFCPSRKLTLHRRAASYFSANSTLYTRSQNTLQSRAISSLFIDIR